MYSSLSISESRAARKRERLQRRRLWAHIPRIGMILSKVASSIAPRQRHAVLQKIFIVLLFGNIFFHIALSVDPPAAQAQSEGLNQLNKSYKESMCKVFNLIERYFGMLISVVAGIGAVIGAAFGAYRLGVGLIVCSCSCFIMRSLISVFFGSISCS